MEQTRAFFESIGLPGREAVDLADSGKRFPDGAQYRIEIPSTEGPAALRAVVAAAKEYRVPVHRVSQGSGIQLMTDDEIREMARIGRGEGMEVSLFVGPRAPFETGAQAFNPAGKSLGWQHRGVDQLVYAIEDIRRACDLGIRGVLVADIGLLSVVGKLKAAGKLPANLVVKTSLLLSAPNPATVKLLEELGAGTVNVTADLSVAQMASIRRAVSLPLDVYIEVPDGFGGFVRYYELPDLIRACAPVYVKLGLRNSPDIYPSGTHIEGTVLALSRERVRRARIALEMIARYCPEATMSAVGAEDLAIPEA
ncbi:MAG: U32 family peptidase [Armatimonadetes bacterium]|nr:U32 family peptidase [Armatimonadota bacterium]